MAVTEFSYLGTYLKRISEGLIKNTN